jgi:hypothetical protein
MQSFGNRFGLDPLPDQPEDLQFAIGQRVARRGCTWPWQPRRDSPLSKEAVRLRTYLKWQGAGQAGGDGVRFWLKAEQELREAK